jgi:hypothetical protein
MMPEVKGANNSLSFFLHLFGNSSDPNSIMSLTKHGTGYLESAFNVSEMSKLFLLNLLNFSITLQCFRMDRFVVMRNESELEQQAMCLMEVEQYLSGIVLSNVNENTTKLPPLVTYKIRHSPALVDGTNSQMDSKRTVLSRDDPWVSK